MNLSNTAIASLPFEQQSHLFALCSKLAYNCPDAGTAEFGKLGLTSEYIDVSDNQVYVLTSDTDTILAFRGTEADFGDIVSDIKVRMRNFPGFGSVHDGFADAVEDVWDKVAATIDRLDGRRLWVTGHSLGAAMATIAAVRIIRRGAIPSINLFTYGSPKVGNGKFATAFAAAPIQHFRFVNNNDVVTRVPPFPYQHTGNVIYMNHWGNVRAMTSYQIAKDRFRGAVKGVTQGSVDSLSDHSSDLYCANLENFANHLEVPQTGL